MLFNPDPPPSAGDLNPTDNWAWYQFQQIQTNLFELEGQLVINGVLVLGGLTSSTLAANLSILGGLDSGDI